MNKDFISVLEEGHASCIVVREGVVLHQTKGIGVKPLLDIYNHHPSDFKGSAVYDTVIGKAASVILILGGASFVYGEVMSVLGRDFLESHGIKTAYKELVPMIRNRTNTDFCPLEKSVCTLEPLDEAFMALNRTIEQLMQNK